MRFLLLMALLCTTACGKDEKDDSIQLNASNCGVFIKELVVTGSIYGAAKVVRNTDVLVYDGQRYIADLECRQMIIDQAEAD